MTLYARQDVSYVVVPTDNGGCGVPHSRPVVNGKPSEKFILTCQPCENFLRADIARSGGNKKVRTINGDTGLALKERYLGLWGASPETIPESPDAELAREMNEQASVTKNAASTTEAFGTIAEAMASNQQLIAKLAEMITAQHALPAPSSEFREPLAPELAGADPSAPTAVVAVSVDEHLCLGCGTPISRKPGQKGALPHRCPDCKVKHATRPRTADKAA